MNKLIQRHGYLQTPAQRTKPPDHFAIDRKWRRVLLDVRVKRGGGVDSDHHLLVGELWMKLAVRKKAGKGVERIFDTTKLADIKVQQKWGIELRNQFHALAEGENIHEKWERCKKAITTTCHTVLGHRDPRRKDHQCNLGGD